MLRSFSVFAFLPIGNKDDSEEIVGNHMPCGLEVVVDILPSVRILGPFLLLFFACSAIIRLYWFWRSSVSCVRGGSGSESESCAVPLFPMVLLLDCLLFLIVFFVGRVSESGTFLPV